MKWRDSSYQHNINIHFSIFPGQIFFQGVLRLHEDVVVVQIRDKRVMEHIVLKGIDCKDYEIQCDIEHH